MLTYNPQTQVQENKPIAMSKKAKQNKNRTNVSAKLVGYQSMYPSISLYNYHDHIINQQRILGGLLKNRCQQFLSNEYPAWTLHTKNLAKYMYMCTDNSNTCTSTAASQNPYSFQTHYRLNI